MKDFFNYDMSPKKTEYKGRIYRSRLEAQWAVFFNTLSLKFQYEPKTYRVERGEGYLPDFHVYGLAGDSFFEVKPLEGISWEAIRKAEVVTQEDLKAITILNGPPDFRFYPRYDFMRCCAACKIVFYEKEPCLICGGESISRLGWAPIAFCNVNSTEAISSKLSVRLGDPIIMGRIPDFPLQSEDLFSDAYVNAVYTSRTTKF